MDETSEQDIGKTVLGLHEYKLHENDKSSAPNDDWETGQLDDGNAPVVMENPSISSTQTSPYGTDSTRKETEIVFFHETENESIEDNTSELHITHDSNLYVDELKATEYVSVMVGLETKNDGTNTDFGAIQPTESKTSKGVIDRDVKMGDSNKSQVQPQDASPFKTLESHNTLLIKKNALPFLYQRYIPSSFQYIPVSWIPSDDTTADEESSQNQTLEDDTIEADTLEADTLSMLDTYVPKFVDVLASDTNVDDVDDGPVFFSYPPQPSMLRPKSTMGDRATEIMSTPASSSPGRFVDARPFEGNQ